MSSRPLPSSPLLDVRNLHIHFPVYKGLFPIPSDFIHAVNGISFTIQRGTTMGLVGESGSGKSTLAKALVGLVPVTSGSLAYTNSNGSTVDLRQLSRRDYLAYRKKLQIIFQDPHHSLNPRFTVLDVIGEALEIHFPKMTRTERRQRVADLLSQVGLKPDHLNRYPHQFSGGQKQRIGIARALAVEPEFIICDEPVSALDVSVQAQIVNLLQDLQESLGLTYLFIAHDLAVVEHVSDDVLVMQFGKIVESASAEEIYQNPQHPYTQQLIQAVPGKSM